MRSETLSTLALRWLPWISLGWFAALWVARWAAFPLVLDPYYHLYIAQQVSDAGGPLAYEWWEYAPVGRPHLYPPFFHLALASLLKLGCPPITALRLISVTMTPTLLLSLFLVMRRLAGPSPALAALWAGLVPFSFHLHTAITMAATVGMIELLWLMDALARERWLAAGLLLGLLGYTHLGLPWIALLMIVGYCLVEPAARNRLVRAGWGLLAAAPWYAHLIRHRAFLHTVPRYENATVELMPLLSVVAAVGAWRCWQMRGRLLWPLASWAGFALLAPTYRFRWLSGEGMLPVILLAGVGMDWLSQRLAAAHVRPPVGGMTPERISERAGSSAGQMERRRVIGSCCLFVLLVCSPTLARRESGRWQWVWPDAAPWHLLDASATIPKTIDASFYSRQMQQLADQVAHASRPGDILWSNARYALGLVAALAHRPMASAMLNEVPAAHPLNAFHAARLIVWFKFDHPVDDDLPAAVPLRGLTKVAESDLAVVFRRNGVTQAARPPQAVVPFWAAFALASAAAGGIVWDLGRSRQSSRRLV